MYIKRLKRDYVLLDMPIAHKGVHGENIRGNSIEAIKLSIENSIPFEIDIVQTRDNVPVIFHDFVIEINDNVYQISKLTYDELLSLTKDTLYIPSLEEVILANNNGTPMILDFKETSFLFMTQYRKNIIHILKDYQGEYAIQAFNPFFLLRMKHELKNALTGQLLCRGKTLIDTFDSCNTPYIGKFYEKLQSTICVISSSDYIGLELHPSTEWNYKAAKLFFEKIDFLQNSIVEITSVITKKPVLGWTLTKLEELEISPSLFTNYICDANNEIDFFSKVYEFQKNRRKK